MTTPTRRDALDRRRLLLGFGASVVTGATAPRLWRIATADAQTARPGPTVPSVPVITSAAPPPPGEACLDQSTFDTLAGVAAFVLPGPDAYSKAQGVTHTAPGAVDAGAAQLVALVLDQVLLDPTGLSLLLDKLGPQLARVPMAGCTDARAALGSAVRQDGTVPLAPIVTAVVNMLALQVDPASVSGPFEAPFARLPWAKKAEVWQRFERDLPALLMPDRFLLDLPVIGPTVALFETLGGLLAYASGAVLELTGFFAYGETLAYDRPTRTLTRRPVGWDNASYLTDVPLAEQMPEGWDDLIGYYQGRTAIDA